MGQPEAKLRILLDCSCPDKKKNNAIKTSANYLLNVKPSLEMADASTLPDLIRYWRRVFGPNVQLQGANIDLAEAYYIIPLQQKDRWFFCFYFEGSYYQFNRLPMGWSPSASLFSRLARVLLFCLVKKANSIGPEIAAFSFLDDTFNVAPTHKAPQSTEFIYDSFNTTYGVQVNENKYLIEGTPSTTPVCLGIHPNLTTMTASITPQRAHDVRVAVLLLAKRATISENELQSLLGTLTWVSIVITSGKPFLFALRAALSGAKNGTM